MNKENATKLWKMIQDTADYLRDQKYTLPHTTPHYFTLGYADNLKFIKNKSHKDSLKTPLKLANKLPTKEINQMACIHNF